MDDSLATFFQFPENVLNVEDIQSYIHCKIESTCDEDRHKDLGTMYNNDLTLKSNYAHLRELNLVKYMFYMMFDNNDWTQIILCRVHDEIFWLGNVQVTIDNNLINRS